MLEAKCRNNIGLTDTVVTFIMLCEVLLIENAYVAIARDFMRYHYFRFCRIISGLLLLGLALLLGLLLLLLLLLIIIIIIIVISFTIIFILLFAGIQFSSNAGIPQSSLHKMQRR